jgi:hypothetical protein
MPEGRGPQPGVPVATEEARAVRLGCVVGDANEDDATRHAGVGRGGAQRRLALARLAPRCPEVQHDRMAFERRQVDRLARLICRAVLSSLPLLGALLAGCGGSGAEHSNNTQQVTTPAAISSDENTVKVQGQTLSPASVTTKAG